MEHNLQVNEKIRGLFRQHKVYVQENQEFDIFGGTIHFDDSLRIEPYVELIGTNGELWSMGTSSYMNASQVPVSTVVGRFSSIAKGVRTLPGGHSQDRFTTSPITFLDEHWIKGGTDDFRYGFAPISMKAELNAGFETVDRSVEELPIVIGNDVWIGSGVLIKPGVHIGNGAVIGINSIVTRDIEPYTVAAGSPAVPRKQRFSDSFAERLEKLAWWQYPYWDFAGIRGDMPVEVFIERIEELIYAGKLQPYNPEPLTARMLLEVAD